MGRLEEAMVLWASEFNIKGFAVLVVDQCETHGSTTMFSAYTLSWRCPWVVPRTGTIVQGTQSQAIHSLVDLQTRGEGLDIITHIKSTRR